jgi:rare lipoprotein A
MKHKVNGPLQRASMTLLCGALAVACAAAPAPRTGAPAPRPGATERGVASWYGAEYHGRPTASGEIYDMHAPTAAHQTLPFGAIVEVKNRENGNRFEVRINDRGPFVKGRIIDLSYAAAERLGMVATGTARVEVTLLRYERPDDGRGAFAVQLGAFRERDRARALAARAGRHYPNVDVYEDDTWSRVQIRGLAGRDEAESLRGELDRAGYDAVIVRVREN